MLVWKPPGDVMLVSLSLNAHKTIALKCYAFSTLEAEVFLLTECIKKKREWNWNAKQCIIGDTVSK